ncbi:ArsR/SmtB family transcription factor [Mesorhizobium sp. 113-3-3]|uniref:ArsR/SmtB family transcription factor n=1 Tax=Mesorhizobium sp. 113-3-3 TaxID=2744516 RepID=UPI001FD13251|nr:metalloregulator ArsR/SmtB family transcription factor [Mesorhizobium sp. 113-3-3]
MAEIKADLTIRRPAEPLTFRDQAAVAARYLTVLGNAKRLLIAVHLIDGERTVGDIADLLGLSHSATCQHLSLLAEQGIIECRAVGTWRYYACKSEEAKEVIRLLDGLAGNQMLPEPPEGPRQRP